MSLKKMLGKISVVGPVINRIRQWTNPQKPFKGSEHYWNSRYDAGGNSGKGSYNELAEFKAEVINEFVSANGIKSVIEYGCGDGNQLGLARYAWYIGFDVSPNAITRCEKRFAGDKSKAFRLMTAYEGETAELTLSLDVIYHLVEDTVFVDYISRLFDSSEKFVIVYSSDFEESREGSPAHVRHRKFSDWVSANRVGWKLLQHVPNKYPYAGDVKHGTSADFYIYVKS